MRISDLSPDIANSSERKFKKLVKNSKEFVQIFSEFIKTKFNSDEFDVGDFIVALRTHLLMKEFKTPDITKYVNTIIITNLRKILDSYKNSENNK